MHNPESVLENETHKFLWDFDIQADHLISARRPDLRIINKKENLKNLDFAIPDGHRVIFKKVKRRINTSTLLGN